MRRTPGVDSNVCQETMFASYLAAIASLNSPGTPPLRGVNKKYLHQYVAIFEWSYNVKRATPEFLRALLGVRRTTICRT